MVYCISQRYTISYMYCKESLLFTQGSILSHIMSWVSDDKLCWWVILCWQCFRRVSLLYLLICTKLLSLCLQQRLVQCVHFEKFYCFIFYLNCFLNVTWVWICLNIFVFERNKKGLGTLPTVLMCLHQITLNYEYNICKCRSIPVSTHYLNFIPDRHSSCFFFLVLFDVIW